MSESASEMVRVLFVDDEENILKSLKRLLMDEEIDILTATCGEAGLEILRANDGVGLIVSDQRMPGLTGVEFLERARELAPDALRIMLTGYADINATIDAINRGGAYRYISKPWNDEEMIQIIRDATRQCRLISENKRLSALVQRQNEELKEWNSNLKSRVLEQTAAIRVSNCELRELNEKLKKSYESCLSAFSGLIELRDQETENHSKNVTQLSVLVAQQLGLPAEEVEVIKVAALLHDIGKIGIADTLLRKNPVSMSLAEQEEYRKHSVRGQAAIDTIEDLRPAGALIRHHHENFDGSGFPDRLAGRSIPLGARIIAMADFLDRAFARSRGVNAMESTLRVLRSQSEVRLDPELTPLIDKPAREVYSKIYPQVHEGPGFYRTRQPLEKSYQLRKAQAVRELFPKDLEEGMVVAREVRSGTGLLLLGVGEKLDNAKINALMRFYRIDPPRRETVAIIPMGKIPWLT